MKNLKILLLASLVGFIFNCQKEVLDDPVNDDISLLKRGVIAAQAGGKRSLWNVKGVWEYRDDVKGGERGIIPDQLIIDFPVGLSEAQKQIIRSNHNVFDFDTCMCQSRSETELWKFQPDPNGLTIEERLLDADADIIIENVDFNYEIKISDVTLQPFPSVGNIQDGINNMVTANTGVVIGLLDTAININVFSQPILYNNGAQPTCNGEIDHFGWNFFGKNNNPLTTNHTHATKLAKIINENLIAENVPHSILIAQAFSESGKSDMHKLLCATGYLISKDVDVINFSFGSTILYNPSYTRLQELIASVEDDIIFVTSAGNTTNNNDAIPHYPSSFNNPNVIAVSALSADLLSLAPFSNFGTTSVDFAARGTDIPFTINGQLEYVEGTSYSAAFVTYKVAKTVHDFPTFLTDGLMNKLTNYGIDNPNISQQIQYPLIFTDDHRPQQPY